MAAAQAGSVFPDLDMLYFHLVDERRTHHHLYITHWPLFWLACGVVILPALRWLRPSYLFPAAAFFVAVMLHMVLDSVAAPLHWLMPFDGTAIELVTVPAVYSNWIWSFVLHWTFGLEIAICLAALWIALRRRKRQPPLEFSGNL
jgi:inner membrane protein